MSLDSRYANTTIHYSFAWAEMCLVLAAIFRRYELQLYNTDRKRDIDYKYDCFLGEPGGDSKGVRVKIIKRYEK